MSQGSDIDDRVVSNLGISDSEDSIDSYDDYETDKQEMMTVTTTETRDQSTVDQVYQFLCLVGYFNTVLPVTIKC